MGASNPNLSQEVQSMTEQETLAMFERAGVDVEGAIVFNPAEWGMVLSPEEEKEYFETVAEQEALEREFSERYPNGYASTGTIIYDDIDPRELYSEAIDLLEKGESIEPLGLNPDLTIEDLQEALFDMNVANFYDHPETSPVVAFTEAQQALEEDPLTNYNPAAESFNEPQLEIGDFYDAFYAQLDTLPLETQPVDPIDAISGGSFFEMIFANVDPNEVSLI